MNKRVAIDGNAELIAELREGAPVDLVAGGQVLGHVTPAPKHDAAAAAAAMERILSLREQVSLGDGLTFRDLIREGRKS